MVYYHRFMLEPIGVDGALEATSFKLYCSPKCRSDDPDTEPHADEDLDSTGACSGHVCESCGKVVVPELNPLMSV